MGGRIYTNLDVRGVIYPDVNAAAKAHGVGPQAVRVAARRGTLHRLGTGRVGVEPMRVQVRGRIYETSKDAAQALGVTPSAVHTAMMRGTLDTLGLPPRYNGATSKPVTLFGMQFPSMAHADRTLGFKVGYVSRSLRRKSKPALQRIMGAVMREAHSRRGGDHGGL